MLLPKSLMPLIFVPPMISSFMTAQKNILISSPVVLSDAISVLTILYWFSQSCNMTLHQAGSSLLSYSGNFSLIIVSLIYCSMALVFVFWVIQKLDLLCLTSLSLLLTIFTLFFCLNIFLPLCPPILSVSLNEISVVSIHSCVLVCIIFHLWNISILFSNSFLSPVNSFFTFFYWLVTLFLSF